MEIRQADLRDLPEIVQIHNQSISCGAIGYTEPFKADLREDWLLSHSPTRPLIVAVLDRRVVGWANLRDYRPGRLAFQHTAELSFHVHGDHRKKGVASALIRRMIAQCSLLGIRTLIAIVLDNNDPSSSLLTKLGFERWGSLPRVAHLQGDTLGHLYLGYHVSPGVEEA